MTDLCNYRCLYCMPEEDVEKGPHSSVLTVEERGEISRAAVKLGVRKSRITGGEPLVRRGILQKPKGHHLTEHASDTPRTMNEIGG